MNIWKNDYFVLCLVYFNICERTFELLTVVLTVTRHVFIHSLINIKEVSVIDTSIYLVVVEVRSYVCRKPLEISKKMSFAVEIVDESLDFLWFSSMESSLRLSWSVLALVFSCFLWWTWKKSSISPPGVGRKKSEP